MSQVLQADAEDAGAVVDLLGAFAVESGFPPLSTAARARLLEHGWGIAPRFAAWIVKDGGEVVAVAIVTEQFSTFAAAPSLYLEDLYVAPRHRGAGHARRLFATLVETLDEGGYGRLDWTCGETSGPAAEFYDAVGGTILRRTCYRTLPHLLRHT